MGIVGFNNTVIKIVDARAPLVIFCRVVVFGLIH